ncbi:MAG: metal-dependent hydrolase [Candidatus ainarchaeum sp.]|nr:metal-dependent hydrolase [Candidatus ainarchaeum sp.]
METGFREHLYAALAASAAIGYALLAHAGWPATELPLPLAAFVASSLLPDIDAPSSKPRRYFRAASAAFLLAAAIALYPELSAIHPAAPFALPVLGFVALESLVPRHRGAMHSPAAAVCAGALAFAAFGSAPVAVMVACGYAFHLLVDFLGDRARL